MWCRVSRNKEGQAEVVITPQGEISTIFQDLVQILGDSEVALQTYALTETEAFKEAFPSTYTVQDVLRYSQNLTTSKLSPQERMDLGDLLSSTELTIDEVYSKVGTFYQNGIFKFGEALARASGLYEDSEISQIFSDSKKVREVSKVLQSFYKEYREGNLEWVQPIPQENVNYGELNKFGKYKVVSDYSLKEQMYEVLQGKRGVAFDRAIETLPFDWIKDRYKNDNSFRKSIKAKYEGRVPVAILGRDMTPKVQDSYDELRRVVRKGDVETISELRFLASIPIESWEKDQSELESELEEVFKSLVSYNIDPNGMVQWVSNLPSSEGQTVLAELANHLEDLHSGQFREQGLRALADMQNKSRGIEGKPLVVYDKVAEGLVKVPAEMSEAELYQNHSLVREGDYYRKVQVQGKDVFSGALDLVIVGRLEVPNHYFYPTAFTKNNKFSKARLEDATNRERLLKDLERGFAREGVKYQGILGSATPSSLAEMMVYRKIYGTESKPSDSELISRIEGFTSRTKYLVEEFVPNFWNKVLKGGEQFIPFKIREGRLEFEGGTYDIQKALLGLSEKDYQNLANYSVISKGNLSKMFPVRSERFSEKSEQIFYANYPTAARRHLGEYSLKDGYLELGYQIPDKFIRVKDTLFQRISGKTYAPIKSYNSDTMVMGEQALPPMPLTEESGVGVEPQPKFRKMSKKQLTSINEKIDECII